jgi:undecaprenyl-diphosphatase
MIRPIVKRRRPIDSSIEKIENEKKRISYSFPSGHSLRNFLLAEVIGTKFPKLKKLLFVYASLNGLSRVMVGKHYPTDILAGGIIGIIVGRRNIIEN